ncbi:hypothetical protein BKA93DRAFT_425367 [Sparassis latifolia]
MDIRQVEDVIRGVLKGAKHVVSYPGSSQYGGLGASSCGLACLNFARIGFAKEDSLFGEELLKAILDKATALDITAICAAWSSTSHLEVEDISQIPLFEKSLKLVSTKYFRPGVKQFASLLKDMKAIPVSCVAVITRPPEIIACLKLSVGPQTVFIVYDSHCRPSHPEGAGFTLSSSIRDTAVILSDILPVDSHLLSHGDLQWQAQLLANCSGHIFVSRGLLSTSADLTQTVIETSLTLLALRAEVNDLKSQQSELAAENKRLLTEMEIMADEHVKERRRLSSSNWSYRDGYGRSPSSWADQATAWPPSSTSGGGDPSHSAWTSPSHSHSQRGATQYGLGGDPNRHTVARQMECRSTGLDCTDAETAAEQQRRFDEEDYLLRLQLSELAKIAPRSFKCGVCFDEQPEDSVCRLDPCGHSFCRECIRSYVSAKIDEHRYPVFCPICMVERDNGNPCVVTQTLLQQIGITEAQYETWVEMEMSRFGVFLHCRKCQGSAFVDKQDLEDTKTLACPLPNCNYIWCKACQQSITIGGPQHSCDGSSELDDLMKRRGWKYCPGCKTPIQKVAGCNHMTCMSPGCNTHFCYLCGGCIIQSALRRDVQAAITTHYRQCRLFEHVPDRDVPP